MAKCISCEAETEGKCWTDCGMSLCGAPLCDDCEHVDEHIGSFRSWRHDKKSTDHTKEGRVMHTIHELKTVNRYWDAVAAGTKTFEVRRNDRAFQTGDVLVLTRTTENGSYDTRAEDRSPEGAFTKSQISFRITYLLQGGQFGIEPGFCVLGLCPVTHQEGE